MSRDPLLVLLDDRVLRFRSTAERWGVGGVATPGVLRACQAANCDSERSARVLANSQDAPPDIRNIHRGNVRVVEGDQGQGPVRPGNVPTYIHFNFLRTQCIVPHSVDIPTRGQGRNVLGRVNEYAIPNGDMKGSGLAMT